MSETRHYRDRMRSARRRGRIVAVIALAVLALVVFLSVARQGEFKSAGNTPGASSPVNNPPPSPPREREPQTAPQQ